MKDLLKLISDWLGSNWGWIVLAGVFVDITPIKFSPISWILKKIGHKMTGDLQDQINELRKDVNSMREDVDAQAKDQIRTTVLDFSNSLLYGTEHTKEEFDHILDLDSKYHNLLKEGEKNSKYNSSMDYINRRYNDCRDHGKFLQIPVSG